VEGVVAKGFQGQKKRDVVDGSTQRKT
jgi:hypothetical protein